jgi:hypothetical protein
MATNHYDDESGEEDSVDESVEEVVVKKRRTKKWKVRSGIVSCEASSRLVGAAF